MVENAEEKKATGRNRKLSKKVYYGTLIVYFVDDLLIVFLSL